MHVWHMSRVHAECGLWMCWLISDTRRLSIVPPPRKHLAVCSKSEHLGPERTVSEGTQKDSLVRHDTLNCRMMGRILTCVEKSKVAWVWIPLTLLPWPLSVIANIPVYLCSWSLPDSIRELASQMVVLTADFSGHQEYGWEGCLGGSVS